jgi:ribose transport system substrate-binding protein
VELLVESVTPKTTEQGEAMTNSNDLPQACDGSAAGRKALRTRALATALGAATLLGGVSVLGLTWPAQAADKLNIAFVVADSADPFYLTMKCGAEKAAADHNVNLTWQGSTSVDYAPQLNILHAVQLKKPDGIVLAPFNPKAFIAPVKSLMDGGVPVVTVDGSLDQKVELQNIHTDNAGAGAAAAGMLGQALNGQGTVGIISFQPGLPVQAARVDGFVNQMQKQFPNVKILPTQYGGADAGKAATITSGLLASNPDLAGIYATDTNDAEGAASAVRAAGKASKVKVVAYDAAPDEVKALRSGVFDGLVAQEPYQEGYRAVALLAKYLRKEIARDQVPYFNQTGAVVVTRDNVDSPEIAHTVLYRDTCS